MVFLGIRARSAEHGAQGLVTLLGPPNVASKEAAHVLSPAQVHCRIGSSENGGVLLIAAQLVHCRIGSSEKVVDALGEHR